MRPGSRRLRYFGCRTSFVSQGTTSQIEADAYSSPCAGLIQPSSMARQLFGDLDVFANLGRAPATRTGIAFALDNPGAAFLCLQK
jgi:hypothetical protein